MNPSSFHFRSTEGSALGLAIRCQAEGHEVSMHLKNPHAKNVGKGLLKHSAEDTAADIIVYEMVGMGAKADELKAAGQLVFGASAFTDEIELKRMAGLNVMEQTPETWPFENKAAAINWIKKNDGRYVVKFDRNLTTASSYVSKGADDLLNWMEGHPYDGSLIIQTFVEGIELSTEKWFADGDEIKGSCTHTIETKKFLAGDLGPNTGCMSSVVWAAPDDDPLVKQAFGPKILEAVKQAHYSGPLDYNGIITKVRKYLGIEWTARFGYNAVYALLELLDIPFSELLILACNGGGSIDLWDGFAFALRLSVPPWPNKGKVPQEPIILPDDPEHIHYQDVMKKGDQLFIAGSDGAILEVTSWGKQVKNCSKEAYKIVKEEIEIPDLQYRIDGTARAEEQMPELEKMGAV